MRFLVAAFALPALLAACGGDDGGSSTDARPIGDEAPIECLATAGGYGNVALLEQFSEKFPTEEDPATTGMIRYAGDLNAEPLYDLFYFELWSGAGALEEGIAPGTYELSGVEADYETCGVCAEVDVDNDDEAETVEQIYFANGGTLTINSVTPNITGTVTNATFVHSDFDEDGHTTPSRSGCTTSITSASFDIVVEEGEDSLRSHVRIPLGKKPHAKHRKARR